MSSNYIAQAQGESTMGMAPCHGYAPRHFGSIFSNTIHASCPTIQTDSGDVKEETSSQGETENIPTVPKAI